MRGGAIDRENVKNADALIIRTRTRCDSKLLEGSTVRLIATATIGTDHIDIPWCEKNGITVTSAPGCNAPGVAQYLFAAIFRSGFDADRHTLGIVGYGNVGSTVGAWARMMEINTIICDPIRKEAGFTDVDYQPLHYVLGESDIISLHVPLTFDTPYPTYHLIGENELALMKKNALLVNSARGGVADEAALKRFIKDGKIRLITDVWENEPYIDRELLDLADIATPHIAGYSLEGKMRGTLMALQSLEKNLGVKVNLEGLECWPIIEERISEQLILKSYNPKNDFAALKASPSDFERLRNQYHFRHEPLFLKDFSD